ncbi:ABC transporter ATP-binding protein [Rickettsia endosymbiont of Cardiosporidium cionae]|uniref:ABC transporter ATP-binding protein n=1 Tax=Rickettsia endosymbiont of Cardiosporidium cionae TaxID=2777155 RepID=UPI0018960BB2|nr:ABC transporter ATP-binding protein [Rickettsia endosymbiont of Cardiosporidium cionae]KAF8818783.1 ABC transporter ATP-binding protein [Rickettsia endosymbiont of Cardiosporidium cionae]
MKLKEQYNTGIQVIKRLINDYGKIYKKNILISILLMLVVAVSAAMVVRLVQPAVDQLLQPKHSDLPNIALIPALMLLLYLIKAVAEYFQTYLMRYTSQEILTKIQMDMYSHLLYTDLQFIHNTSPGKLISGFTNDIMLTRGIISNMFILWCKHFLTILLLVIMMFNLEFKLSIMVLILFPAAIYPVNKLAMKLRKISDNTQEILSNYTKKLDETFYSIKLIKSFVAESLEIGRAQKISEEILFFYKKAAKFESITSPIMEMLLGITIALILLYGGIMISDNKTTAGSLVSFIAALVSVYRPFKSLLSLNMSLQEAIAASNRIFKILDSKTLIQDKIGAIDIKLDNAVIKFLNVSFMVGKKNIINNLDLTFYPGKVYAISGKSGSGKTSISNLLLRFYDVNDGEILLGGYNIQSVSLKSIRSQIDLLTQESILLDDSIINNITYGQSNKNYNEIIRVAKYAHVYEFLDNTKTDHNNNLVGNKGFKLSGGQKQRIAIARSLLRNAPILIMDESTNALDIEAERTILDSIMKLRKGKTTIIINHRLLSIIHIVDQIMLIKSGRLVAQGSHEELIVNNLEYKRLFDKSLKSK